jgi:hypothetical protein
MATLSSKQTFPRWVYRWFAGKPLDGRRRTNCTWSKPGDKLLYPAPVHAWAYQPASTRSAVRQAFAVGIPATVYAWFFYRPELIAVAALAAFAAAVLGGLAARRAVRDWHVNRTYVQPLHEALRYALDLPDNIPASDYIDVPATFAKHADTPVKVLLPNHFDASADNQQRIGGLIIQKLNQSERTMTAAFSTVGRPSVLVKWEPKPPEEVLINQEIVERLDQLGPSEILIGVDASDTLISQDMATESPHWAFSCESGAGKSAFLEFVAAQVLRKDPENEVWYCDPKFASLPGLVGVPGVRSERDPMGPGIVKMWELIEEAAAETMRRGQVLQADPTAEFPMLLFIIDEVNVLASFSKSYWQNKLGEKGQPPLWSDLLTILAAGRQFHVHAIIVGQDLRESALGGIGLRAMLGLRGIGGLYDAQMWARFMQTRPIERPSNIKGRWNYRLPKGQKWIQNVYATHAQINDLARCHPMSHPVLVEHGTAENRDTDIGTNRDRVVGNAAAADYLGITVDAFIQRRKRAELLPVGKQGNKPVFTIEQLNSLNGVSA